MMKKRLLSVVCLALTAVGCCALGACKDAEKGDKGDHTWSTTYSYDATYHWYACSVCGTAGDKTEHTNDEECTVCGCPTSGTAGILYDMSADGTYAEVIGYEGTATTVRIADTYNGVLVTSIYKEAFRNKDNITEVIMPDSVTTIGERAFYNCGNLTSVVIPDSVTTIGERAFEDCYCLTSVVIPDSVTTIGWSAFRYCSSLTSVVIGDSVTTIGGWAFSNCSSLTSVVIPDSVTTIGDYAFSSCSRLTSVVIGDSVTMIGDDAFSNCDSLTSVEIPDSVTTIGERAFSYCGNLTSVVIGDSVTTIGSSAFNSCSSLTSVYYKGTASEWENISIGDNNYRLTAATRYYYDESESVASWWHYDGNGNVVHA